MGATLKALVLAAGYACAVAAAMAASAFQEARSVGQSDGMVAFSLTLVFAAVFGLVALVPTGVGLYWLRAHSGFWMILSRAALSVAVTAVAAALVIIVAPETIWAAFGVLRLFATPVLGAAFAMSAAIAPDRGSRTLLALAAGMEGLGAVYGFGRLFLAWTL